MRIGDMAALDYGARRTTNPPADPEYMGFIRLAGRYYRTEISRPNPREALADAQYFLEQAQAAGHIVPRKAIRP